MRWEIAKRELKESAKGEERELSEQIHSEILILLFHNFIQCRCFELSSFWELCVFKCLEKV